MGVTYEGECESKAALAVFEAACVGKESCTVWHTEDFCAAAHTNVVVEAAAALTFCATSTTRPSVPEVGSPCHHGRWR
jgi:hypothetical protein